MKQTLAGPESHLKREIGRIGVATIAMNGVIGSGIFALPAVAIAQAGAFSPWLFLLCGILILTVALTLARNASFFESTGGPIVYTTVAHLHRIGPERCAGLNARRLHTQRGVHGRPSPFQP